MPNKDEVTILFLGDIVGPLGREVVQRYIKAYKNKKKIDFIIANGENATHGHGLSFAHYNHLLSVGVNVLTSGNHHLNTHDALNPDLNFEYAIRPINLDKSVPGIGTKVFNINDKIKIRVSNALGRVFIPLCQTNPFYDIDDIIDEKENLIHIIDFHAEATAEKRAFGEYFDGRVSAIIGTHTHVQTNDAKFLNKGTFFISDVGMNGAYDSILGDDKEGCMLRTITGKPAMFNVPRKGKMLCNGVILKINTKTNKVSSFEVVNQTFEY